VGREPRDQLWRSRAASKRQGALLGHHMSVYSRTQWLGGISDAWLPRDRPPVLKLWIEVEGGIMLKVRRDYERGKEPIAEPLDRTISVSDSTHGGRPGELGDREQQHSCS